MVLWRQFDEIGETGWNLWANRFDGSVWGEA